MTVGSDIPGPPGDPGLPGLDGEYGKYISSTQFPFWFPFIFPFSLLSTPTFSSPISFPFLSFSFVSFHQSYFISFPQSSILTFLFSSPFLIFLSFPFLSHSPLRSSLPFLLTPSSSFSSRFPRSSRSSRAAWSRHSSGRQR